MNHFITKNFSSVGGAGGGGGQNDPPQPPVLNPPKLGSLSSLSSYSYSESVDALSEGPIEGVVNQNGQYLDGHRIFEGIYIDDVPIKKSVNPLDSSIPKSTVSLSSILNQVSEPWIVNETFQDFSLNQLTLGDRSYNPAGSVSNPYRSFLVSNEAMSAEIIFSKKDIAKAILKGFNLLKKVANDLLLPEEVTSAAKKKLLRYESFSTASIIENQLLKDYPSSSEYPFFCVKINLGNVYDESEPIQPIDDIPIGKNTNFFLEDDICNKVFKKIEISEIGKTRTLRPPSYIDTSYIYNTDTLGIGGYIYLFGVHESSFPTKETILSLKEDVNNFHIIDFSQETYNYSNILAEIRNGEELQQPLGFFDKTYLDKQYGIKLLGPFSNQGESLKVVNFGKSANVDGVVFPLSESSTDASVSQSEELISVEDRILLEPLWNLEERLQRSGSLYRTTLKDISSIGKGSKKRITTSETGFSFIITFYQGKTGYITVRIEKNTNVFSRSVSAFRFIPQRGGGVSKEVTPIAVSASTTQKYTAMAVILASSVEGSLDTRASKSYSNWSTSSSSQFDEEPNSVVHIIRNPNVSAVSVTMGIRALSDTAETTRILAGTTTSVDAGSKIPSAIRFKIELGLQDQNGVDLPPTKSVVYQVIGLTESPALIDIGRTENSGNIPTYSRFIQGTENIASPLTLPQPTEGFQRYVKITRTTFETYSVLIRREISVEKITEIIDAKFSYPNTAIVGIKLDSRTLSALPPRSYDVRLKRILVPSNYFPLKPNGVDKRIYKTKSDFDLALVKDKLIYDGDWDGTFKEAWSDNPAWILFDLLINTRYGLGNYVSADQINIWELYKIGRFCDAVDDDGYFSGVSSATGGLESRYSCNIIIADKVNVFDAIKNLVSTFRGNIFYSNSYIDFTDDRVKLPKGFFNNQNVRDGTFNYTNSRRDQQYNTLEVSYFDRDDSFKVKTEYIEDPEDIKKRGVLRSEIDTFGVTSRAHANRIGKHIIYSTINENQAVSFICGPEILSCRPGDLISIEDDLKSLQKNIGRVLDIDYTNKILRLDEQFNTGNFLNEVSLFVPTGQKTYSDYYDLAVSPSKLAINQLYSNDVPQIATFKTSGYQNLDYGCKLFINQTGENTLLLDKAKIGGIYSITLSGLKQEIYKLTNVRENSPLEYEVSALKFDTGKFGQIESGQNLVDFYNNYPNVALPTQGSATISQNNLYQLSYPVIYSLSTGNYDQQNDSIDISGSWSGVNGATNYDYELVTPRFSSITGRTTGLSVTFTDQTQAGRFNLRVSARNDLSIPNPIGPTYSSGITVLSYSAPIRTNSVFAGINIKN